VDVTIKKIVQLLSDERMDRKCAAAMVLAELRVKDQEAIEGLGRCLLEDNRILQLYALEALAHIRSFQVTQLVLPLLDSADEEVRARASTLVASQGSKALTALSKELQSAPLTRRRTIITILSHNHDRQTMDRLLGLLSDPETGEYTLNALRSEVELMSAEDADRLRDRAAAMLKEKGRQSDPIGTGRFLRLIGYMRDPRSVRSILPFAAEKNPLPLRLAAISALRRPLAASSSAEKAIESLLTYADDPDPTLSRASLDTLRGLRFSAEMTDALTRLTKGRHADARKYALEMLGRLGDQSAVKSVMAHLFADDPSAREAAARSLAHLDGAAAALLKELELSLENETRMEVLCRLLRGQVNALKPAQRKVIADLAEKSQDQDKPIAGRLLDLLYAIDPKEYEKLLTLRAHSVRKAKRYAEAFGLYSKLGSKGLLDDENKYAALICGLMALPNKKELGRASRTTDPVLRLLVDLISNGNNISGRLKKEKSLTPEDLFFIGFNFSESKDEDEKELGGALLEHLSTHSPRSKLGRSAKNKLHLVGLE
jgi:HEAT repeat protein